MIQKPSNVLFSERTVFGTLLPVKESRSLNLKPLMVRETASKRSVALRCFCLFYINHSKSAVISNSMMNFQFYLLVLMCTSCLAHGTPSFASYEKRLNLEPVKSIHVMNLNADLTIIQNVQSTHLTRNDSNETN